MSELLIELLSLYLPLYNIIITFTLLRFEDGWWHSRADVYGLVANATVCMDCRWHAGGAFIKVESGEMYRVQSVRGAADGLADTIAHRDGLFVCLLCRNSDKPGTALPPDTTPDR